MRHREEKVVKFEKIWIWENNYKFESPEIPTNIKSPGSEWKEELPGEVSFM